MQELIDVIRTAITSGATSEQKAAGVQACRTIVAALATEPGKPIVLPGTPQAHPISRLSIDQVLDLMIGRLSTIANERDTSTPPAPTPSALNIPYTPAVLPRVVSRPAPKPARARKTLATRKP